MIDDYSADVSTTGFYSILAPPVSGINEDAQDHDWFRIPDFLRFYQYEIRIFRSQDNNFKTFGSFELFDGAGNSIMNPRFSSVPEVFGYQHFRPSNRDHFLSVGNGAGGYQVYISVVDGASDTAAGAGGLRFADREFHAGAIEETGDIDFYTYRLYRGVQYSIDVLGQASNSTSGTTLGNPQISIYTDRGQFVADDLSSGTGTNSQVNFSVGSTDTYLIRVRGAAGSTGSYVLQSDQFDDLPADISTTAVLPTDGTVVGGQGNFHLDIDYRRVELADAVTYQFTATAGLALFDENGNRLNPDYGSNFREFTYRRTTEQSSTFYVSTVSSYDYEISAQVIDDYGSTVRQWGVWNLSQGTRIGAVETPGDRDWFREVLHPWGRYDYEIVGYGDTPVDVPALSIRSTTDGSLVRDLGRNPGFFVPQDMYGRPQGIFIGARSNDLSATGAYMITFRPGDHSAANSSTQWNVDMSTGVGRIRDAFETEGDVDWHRVSMKPETWYEIQQFGSIRQFNVVQPNNISTTYSSGQRFIYSGDGGDHYIVMHSSTLFDPDRRSYETKIIEGSIRKVDSGVFYSPWFREGLSVSTNLNPNRDVQVFSFAELRYETNGGNPVIIQPGRLTTLRYHEFATLAPRPNFSGVGEVFVRGELGLSNPGLSPDHTAWASIEIYGRPRNENIAPDPANEPDFQVSYAFAEGLPSYLTGVYSGFEALTVDEQNAMEKALSRWDDADNGIQYTRLDPGAGNDAADTMIFKAALNTDVMAFFVGADEGGDIILNTNSPLWSDLAEGGEGFFRMLRGVGTSLGLESTLTLGRHLSVMGNTNPSGNWNALPFASFPTPMDIRAVRAEDNFFPHYGIQPGPTMFPLSGDPVYGTIVDAGNEETVTAEGVLDPVTIDLRPEMLSFVGDRFQSQHTWMNSPFALPKNGYGGEGDDRLTGNHLDNTLIGNAGRDIIVGGVGSDLLAGGEGNDLYIIRPGHGRDQILEQSTGGVDTIRYEGLHNMSSLEDDLTFERLGDDLLIRLEWDQVANRNSDSIRIRNMSDVESRVESLSLLNPVGFIVKVSLVSVFDQLTESRQRFEIASGSDGFGRLVAPV